MGIVEPVVQQAGTGAVTHVPYEHTPLTQSALTAHPGMQRESKENNPS
jgi:hypothetical protein